MVLNTFDFQFIITNTMQKSFFPAMKNNLWGFIDLEGNIIIEAQYNKVSEIFEDVFFAESMPK